MWSRLTNILLHEPALATILRPAKALVLITTSLYRRAWPRGAGAVSRLGRATGVTVEQVQGRPSGLSQLRQRRCRAFKARVLALAAWPMRLMPAGS